jgi:excinuclease ABC subunit A
VIKTADWVIDMGPEGGSGGGKVIASGSPEDVAASKISHTGKFLGPLLEAGRKANAAKKQTVKADADSSAATKSVVTKSAPAKKTAASKPAVKATATESGSAKKATATKSAPAKKATTKKPVTKSAKSAKS